MQHITKHGGTYPFQVKMCLVNRGGCDGHGGHFHKVGGPDSGGASWRLQVVAPPQQLLGCQALLFLGSLTCHLPGHRLKWRKTNCKQNLEWLLTLDFVISRKSRKHIPLKKLFKILIFFFF